MLLAYFFFTLNCLSVCLSLNYTFFSSNLNPVYISCLACTFSSHLDVYLSFDFIRTLSFSFCSFYFVILSQPLFLLSVFLIYFVMSSEPLFLLSFFLIKPLIFLAEFVCHFALYEYIINHAFPIYLYLPVYFSLFLS